MADASLVDTNILLRSAQPHHIQNPAALAALGALRAQGQTLYVCSQNIVEFWSVATKPPDVNGLGLSIVETEILVQEIESSYQYLQDDPRVQGVWRKLVAAYQVSGRQVYDARLVAVMLVHGVTHLLTFNTDDFRRYHEITAVHTSTIAISS